MSQDSGMTAEINVLLLSTFQSWDTFIMYFLSPTLNAQSLLIGEWHLLTTDQLGSGIVYGSHVFEKMLDTTAVTKSSFSKTD